MGHSKIWFLRICGIKRGGESFPAAHVIFNKHGCNWKTSKNHECLDILRLFGSKRLFFADCLAETGGYDAIVVVQIGFDGAVFESGSLKDSLHGIGLGGTDFDDQVAVWAQV